ncbi:XdhC family protein [Rhodococcus pyridinivorans]|uniref:XdhC family protein n=1 Tax=Rhodococcus pyridinivorans TaxID=103816 RepID=UPI0020C6EC42|nr:XdhC/CoxI family protein [Rhodococcus pyridinivorans]UTM39364.1 XdhC family protein [Rhodococcus pyridinivorans]
MHAILEDIYRELAAGRKIAVATVAATHGSSPRKPGAMLAVHEDHSVVGSISGGCVEGALYETALEVLHDGVARIERYGPEGDLLAPGLTCGGTLSVLVERFDRQSMPFIYDLCQAVRTNCTVVSESVICENGTMTHQVVPDTGQQVGLGPSGSLIRRFEARPDMVIVGSTDFAAEMGRLGMRLGYRVTICDARPLFTTRARFPEVDEVVCEWPSDWIAAEREFGRFDSRSVFIVLTHDPKIDVPALVECLDRRRWSEQPAYVGAMGSRTADTNRRRDLLGCGLPTEFLQSLHSPIGLPIGNSGPAETAVSIAAQLISLRG